MDLTHFIFRKSAAEKAQSLGAIPPVATSSQRDFTMNTTEFQSEKTDSLLSSRLLPSSVSFCVIFILMLIQTIKWLSGGLSN